MPSTEPSAVDVPGPSAGDPLKASDHADSRTAPARGQAKTKQAVSLAFAFFLAAFATYGYLTYRMESRRALACLDEKLLMAAHTIPAVLGRDFFTRATGPDAIDPADDRTNIERLTRLADAIEASYLYSMVFIDGRVHLTSSSASAEERRTDSAVRYWTSYDEVTKDVQAAIAHGAPRFANYRDRWGHFRHVYIPLPGDGEIVHIVAADLEFGTVLAALRRRILFATLGIFGLLVAGIPLFIAYRSRMRRSLRAIRSSHHALSQSEDRFRSYIENATDLVYALSTDGRLTYVSPNWEEHLGQPPDRMIGRPFTDCVEPADRAACSDFVQRILTTGTKQSSNDYRIRLSNGTYRWHRANGAPLHNHAGNVTGCIVIARDVTETRETLRCLSENERELRAALRLARLGSWTLDLQRDELHPSPALLELLGLERDTAPLPLEEGFTLVHPDHHAELRHDLELARQLGSCFTGEWRVRHSDGHMLWLQTVIESVEHDADGRPVRCFGISQDVTERRQMQERLNQMEKMQAIGQLAGGVAHDFNNQLGGIMGYADLVRMRAGEPQLQRAAERILVCAKRAEELTRQLLAFSRKQDYQQTVIDVHLIIHEVATMLEHSLDKRIALHQRLDAPCATILGDATQIQSAILNLAINARDAMPDGGELTFATANRTLTAGPHQLPDELSPGSYLLLQVEDTGCGIPPGIRDHIFEPFFTTKEVGRGTGMGLAAVYGTVANHGGCIEVSSEPEMGSCFTILLPTHEGGDDPASEPAIAARPFHGVRALVIEDEEMLRELAREMLTDLGCTVATEPDGQAGIDHYAEHHATIDVVLLDMVMPRLSGSEVLHAIRTIDPAARVLVVSGHGTRDGTEQHCVQDAAMLLRKPYQQSDLALALQRLLERPGS